jgi:hypothetical protein
LRPGLIDVSDVGAENLVHVMQRGDIR